MTNHEAHGHALAGQMLEQHPEFESPHSLEIDETVPPRPEEEIADSR